MKIIEKKIFICPICRNKYTKKNEALKCLNKGIDEPIVKVGDICELKYGFGWFDGNVKWVINPNVDMSKHGFGPDCSMGFYYVITAIDNDGHRTRYHVATKAMTGDLGHKACYTFARGHYTPKLINAPDFVRQDSRDLIGNKSKCLQ